MPQDRFVIAPLDTGLQNDVKPFLIPDDAFAQLNNAYIFRGRVTKRWGSELMNTTVPDNVAQLYSRLGMRIGTTNGAGLFGPFIVPGNQFNIGQVFAIGDQIYTVFQTGNPAPMLVTVPGPIASFDTTTGAVQFAGAQANTDVYWYPALPVMGLPNYQQAPINNEPLFAFDTQFSYTFDGTRWQSLENPPVKIWTGTDSQFFWSYNFRGVQASDYVLFTTNYNPPDFMAYWAGGPNWTNFRPTYDVAGHTVDTCRAIIAFKGRLLLLNTVETSAAGQQTFSQRCRYSQVGNPVEADAFHQLPETAGKGGFLDASTRESIISCQIIKDRLIVFFEESTWELVFTNNDANPFIWQKINTELGAESTFSAVVFDKVLLGVGNVGIVACNGANVDRIDQKIPNAVFQIRNENTGIERVYGIRDYYHEMVYWTYPTETVNNVFPTKVLAYNYRNGSWAFFDDSITCFGYFQKEQDATWQSSSVRWQDAVQTWDSATLQAQFRNIVCGNQEGFVFVANDEVTVNAPALSITNLSQAFPGDFQHIVFTVIDHNLAEEDFIYIENIVGNNDFLFFNNTVQQVYQRIDSDTFIVQLPQGTQLSIYDGGGTIRLVSRLDILTKMYNFYPQAMRNMCVNKIDFNIDTTANGAISVDGFSSSSDLGTNAGAELTGAMLGTGNLNMTPYPLVPQEANRSYLIHPVYMQINGTWIQLRLYYSDEQMFNYLISSSDFELNAMMFYASLTANRLQ